MKKNKYDKIKIIFELFIRYFKYNICFAVLSLMTLVAAYSSPMINAVIIDNGINKGNVKVLIYGVLVYLAINAVNEVLIYIRTMINLKYQYVVEQDIKNEIIKYYVGTYRADLNKASGGELETLIKSDVNHFISLISRNIQDILISILRMIISLFFLLKLQTTLGIIVIAIQFAIVYAKKAFNEKLAENSVNIRKSYVTVMERINEIIYNIKDLSLVKADKYLVNRYNNAYYESYQQDKKSTRISQNIFSIVNILGLLMDCTILVLGGFFVIKGEITLGILISFMRYASMVSAPLNDILDIPSQYSNYKKSIDCVFDVLLSMKNQKSTSHDINNIKSKKHVERISIDNVAFEYENGNCIFDGASAIFAKNKINYIVGRSGVGKSTLVKLILGKIVAKSGEILFDDISIKDIIDNNEIPQYISWVPQEPVLFRDTIRNNLLLGSDVSEDRLISACEECSILEDINNLPDGFDTMLGDFGDNLSVGQKHRLGLVRALLQENPIIIIDEGTAGLDYQTEQMIKDNIQKFCKDKIAIIITHSEDFIVDGSTVYEIKDKKIEEKVAVKFP